MQLSLAQPFVLLDDARDLGASPSLFYRQPAEVIQAREADGVRPALAQLRSAITADRHVAGFLSYEAGLALEDRLSGLHMDIGAPLLWFGVFEECETLSQDEVGKLLPDPEGAIGLSLDPEIMRSDYDERFAVITEAIRAGDIYQTNLTFPNMLRFAGDPLSLYADIRRRAKAGYGGIVWTGGELILSFSPELFFALEGRKLTTKPMKGTAPRRSEAGADAREANLLQTDIKQRAENLMIVDLLRNDMSRVCEAGSVEVPHLFAIESYPTVHQMTSTVTGILADGKDAVDVLAALFPCGSITGAPKIRAMELIHQTESAPRSIYTGSIGRIDPDGRAAFNVAIRTLELAPAKDNGHARLGLGSGIVADSQAGDEWAECLLKGRFVLGQDHRFDLIETMRFEPEGGIALLERHLARMKASAEALGFVFDRHDARNELQVATFRQSEPCKVRLLASCNGALAIELSPLPETSAELGVALAPMPVAPDDIRLSHKTTDRHFYDSARLESGADEMVFVGEGGKLTEGSFTNIFVERDGKLVTPPVSLGLLPGVLRAEMLDDSRAFEGEVTAKDLANGFFLGNALRGLMRARLAG